MVARAFRLREQVLHSDGVCLGVFRIGSDMGILRVYLYLYVEEQMNEQASLRMAFKGSGGCICHEVFHAQWNIRWRLHGSQQVVAFRMIGWVYALHPNFSYYY